MPTDPLETAYERGKEDGQNGYQGPDMADIADLVLEVTNDQMDFKEYNEAAQAVASAYARGYGNGVNEGDDAD